MRDAVIVGAVRTPIGKGKLTGSLSPVHPVDLLAHSLRALADRTGIDPAEIDDVIGGCVGQVGEQAVNRHGARCSPPGSRARTGHHRRPPVRVLPAGRPLRRTGHDRGRIRHGDRLRCGEDEPRADGVVLNRPGPVRPEGGEPLSRRPDLAGDLRRTRRGQMAADRRAREFSAVRSSGPPRPATGARSRARSCPSRCAARTARRGRRHR